MFSKKITENVGLFWRTFNNFNKSVCISISFLIITFLVFPLLFHLYILFLCPSSLHQLLTDAALRQGTHQPPTPGCHSGSAMTPACGLTTRPPTCPNLKCMHSQMQQLRLRWGITVSSALIHARLLMLQLLTRIFCVNVNFLVNLNFSSSFYHKIKAAFSV